MTKLVSDGCLCHVSLKIDAADAIAAHEMRTLQIAKKVAGSKSSAEVDALCKEGIRAYDATDAARKKIEELVKLALRCLISMGEEPSVKEGDKVELRLLLCRVEQ